MQDGSEYFVRLQRMSTSKPVLHIIIGSTRPGRVGEPIAHWFFKIAEEHDEFDIKIIDLKEVELPILDEPNHPARREYTHDHTKRWSESVGSADAFVFVVPEYNHSMNAATKNAIDYLFWEWQQKPVGIVCYGGVSRGLRAAQTLKPIFSGLKMPHCGDVAITLILTPVEEGVFEGDAALKKSAHDLLDELARFTPIYQELRA
jgi:NAD(P)H-dependent FMN reductase